MSDLILTGGSAASITSAEIAAYNDGKCFTNKMHPECLHDLQEWAGGGGFEYMLYCGDRPKILAPNA